MRGNWQTLDANCDFTIGPSALLRIPTDCYGSQDSKKVRQKVIALTVLEFQPFLMVTRHIFEKILIIFEKYSLFLKNNNHF